MKLNTAYARQLRADYATFLKEEGITEAESHQHPMKMSAAMGKVARKHVDSHSEDMFGFRKFFNRTFKVEFDLIHKGTVGGSRENPGQAT